MRWLIGGVLVALAGLGCSDAGSDGAEIPLAERGARVYKANCMVCHNADPSLVGSVGPEIAGSSRELIEARVLNKSYPPGYLPKRDTSLMPAMPYLQGDLDALAAFLALDSASREPATP